MNTDPIIAEVRHARDVLAAKFNYDVAAIVRDAQKRQKQLKLKVVSLKPRKGTWPNSKVLPRTGADVTPAASTATLPPPCSGRASRAGG